MVSRRLIALFLLACVGFIHVPLAWTQANVQSASESKAGPNQPTNSENFGSIRSDLDALKLSGFGAILVAAFLGLTAYGAMHRHTLPRAITVGLLIAVTTAPLFFWSASKVLLSEDATACLTASLTTGPNATLFDDVCRSGRESAADFLFLTTAWHMIKGQYDENGRLVAMKAGVVLAIMYFSVIVGAAIVFGLLRPLWRRWQYVHFKRVK